MESSRFSEKLCRFFFEFETITAGNDGPLKYASFAFSMLICIVGLVGNALVICVTRFGMKNKKSTIWFLNLAVADFIFLLFLPINAVFELKGSWSYGAHVCKMYHFLSNVNMYASIFILTALTIDRLLSVAKPIWHHNFMSTRVSYFICVLIWIITALASLPAAHFSDEYKINETTQCLLGFIGNNENVRHEIETTNEKQNTTVFDFFFRDVYFEEWIFRRYNNTEDIRPTGTGSGFSGSAGPSLLKSLKFFFIVTFSAESSNRLPFDQKQCHSSAWFDDEEEVATWNQMMFTTESLLIPLIVFGFVIPLCVITICNFIIYLKVKKSQSAKISRLYWTVLTLVLVFFLSWTPLITAQVISMVAARNFNFALFFKINRVLPLLSSIAYSNSCLNPIMYVLISKNSRSALTDSISGIKLSFSKNSKSL